ncbi:circadian associated repressor of transcription a [Kryptolebias marmoratus]|uniref:Circadian associated repressor of transcription a n=1 Tax=Kryptolebias marmoratus TaxID=37003 RepID=A0A3Q3FU07_KRYMA|nr:circadian associated repressor of transcription a [Kryptolebias marmoratus]
MNSLGKSSKWPSYDSLPSTSSFPLSESEQTEDEADVSSEGESDAGVKRPSSADESLARLPGGYLHVARRPDQLLSRLNADQPELRPDKAKHPSAPPSPDAASLGASSSTPGDLAFAQKCADLRRFICPLLKLLRGLKAGRFEKGLTSYQQAVAIDRLQRILGMLQKPEMGEKYLQSLLQIEMLLKTWFPQDKMKPTNTSSPTTTPHRCQNQLHIPVKKRKLSWFTADEVPAKHTHHQKHKPRLPPSPQSYAAAEGQTAEATDWTGPLSGRWENREPPEAPLSSPRWSPATQDCSVSSSNCITTSDSP